MTMLTPDFSSRPDTSASKEVSDPITELLRGHARELIAVALEAKCSWCSTNYATMVVTSCATATCPSVTSPRPSVTLRSRSPASVRVTARA